MVAIPHNDEEKNCDGSCRGGLQHSEDVYSSPSPETLSLEQTRAREESCGMYNGLIIKMKILILVPVFKPLYTLGNLIYNK